MIKKLSIEMKKLLAYKTSQTNTVQNFYTYVKCIRTIIILSPIH